MFSLIILYAEFYSAFKPLCLDRLLPVYMLIAPRHIFNSVYSILFLFLLFFFNETSDIIWTFPVFSPASLFSFRVSGRIVFIFIFPPDLLRYNWQTTLYKFKGSNMMIQYTYICTVCCKMFITVGLVHTSISRHNSHFILVVMARTWKLHSQEYSAVLSAIVTMLLLRSPDLLILSLGVCPLWPTAAHVPHFSAPSNHRSTLCFYEFDVCRFHI